MHSLRRILAHCRRLPRTPAAAFKATLRRTADSGGHQGPGLGRPQHRPRSYGSDASRSATEAVHTAEGNRKRRRHKTTPRGAREENEQHEHQRLAPALISRTSLATRPIGFRVRSVTPHVDCRIMRRLLRQPFKRYYIIDMGLSCIRR